VGFSILDGLSMGYPHLLSRHWRVHV
jgi:hypothetical protein